jgi:hypothetical protein
MALCAVEDGGWSIREWTQILECGSFIREIFVDGLSRY